MRALLALLLLPAAAAPVRSDPALELGTRLSEQATAFIEQLVGPGRGRALVTVEAQSSRSHSERELSEPLSSVQATGILPGYVQGQTKSTTITSREITDSSNDLNIQKIHVAVVLDQGLNAAQVAAVSRTLPQLLQMNKARGDDLVVVRAALRAPWKAALESPESLRAGLMALALLVSIFILALAGYLAALSFIRVLSSELEARRPQPLPPPAAPAFGPLPAMEGEIVGDNGLPSLSGGAESAASRGGQPARLGQRFDFLAPLNPEELAALLAEESVEDLSQLLAALAKTGPDLASLVFAALPAALQPRVSQTLATLRTSDPDRLSDIEATLRERSERMVRGAERLGAILSRLPPQQREGLLGDIVVSNPDLAARVEKAVFSFEDILRLPPIELRRLLSAMPYEEWGIALQGAPQPLVDAVVGQLPEGAAEALRESLAASVPSARVLSARSRALDRARALIEEGQIASAAAR